MQTEREYSFDNFIIGGPNKLAFMAAKQVADKPGETYNPLFIYGRSGLGKTHLLNAIYKHIHELYPDLSVCMVTADELVRHMIKSAQAGQTDEWRRDMLSADVLLIDDAHILTGKKHTQAAFVRLIRDCVSKKHQVVMTSSEDPETLPVLESSLRSDYGWALLADIRDIDIETRRLIAIERAARSGLSLSDEMLEHIVSHADGNVRRIEGFIDGFHLKDHTSM